MVHLVSQVRAFLLLQYRMLDSLVLVLVPHSVFLCPALPPGVLLPARSSRGLQVALACFPGRPVSSRTVRAFDVDRQVAS